MVQDNGIGKLFSPKCFTKNLCLVIEPKIIIYYNTKKKRLVKLTFKNTSIGADERIRGDSIEYGIVSWQQCDCRISRS